MGTVLKVVSMAKESWHHMEPLLLEELQVFQVRRWPSAALQSEPPSTPLCCVYSELCWVLQLLGCGR